MAASRIRHDTLIGPVKKDPVIEEEDVDKD